MAIDPSQMSALAGMYENAGALQAREISNRYKLGREEVKARLKIASIESKDRRYGIDAERETAREQIAQAREEMERVGIPRMEIERFVAEANRAIAEAELAIKRDEFLAQTTGYYQGNQTLEREELARRYGLDLDRLKYDREQLAENRRQFGMTFGEQQRQFGMTFGEQQRQFNVGASGYMGGTLTPAQQQRYSEITARDQQLRAAGQPGLSPAEQAELAQYENIVSGAAGGGAPTLEREELARRYELERQELARRFGLSEAEVTGLYGGAPTLEAQELARRYGLDVAKFGAELASTPDTYFQARRFQGVDVPRLMGGAGAPTAGPTGAPTPGVATMGAYLSGQDPYAAPAAAAAAPTPYGGAAPSYGGGGASTGYEPPTGPGSAAPGGNEQIAGATYGTPVFYGQPDPRVKQVTAVARAVPPSPYDGLNEQDTAALRLMESIYKRGGQGIAGGEMERLKASGRMGFLSSAGRLLGYDPNELTSTYEAYRPAQESSRLA